MTDLDIPGEQKHFTGSELMEKGLPIVVTKQPGAVVIIYKRASDN